jgi:hypothetical protein
MTAHLPGVVQALKYTPITHMHDLSFTWLGTGT